MADNQEFVCQQRWMIERIGDAPQHPIRLGPNDRSVFIKLNIGNNLRQLEQLAGNRRSLDRRCIGLRLNPFQGLLTQGSDIEIRRRFKPGKLVYPFFRCPAFLGLAAAWKRHEAYPPDLSPPAYPPLSP